MMIRMIRAGWSDKRAVGGNDVLRPIENVFAEPRTFFFEAHPTAELLSLFYYYFSYITIIKKKKILSFG